MISVEGLTCGYPNRPVLHDVALELKPGEVVAVLGPNGSGKSTLLKAIAGLVPISAGRIEVDGRNLNEMPKRELAQKIGFVPQEEAWDFSFSALEVVAMGRIPGSNTFFDTKEDRQIAESAMEEAGCRDLADRFVTEISGGEKQRVLIARALAQQTNYLFLDEPTTHLDPAHDQAINALIKSLAKANRAVVVAIHDLTVAADLASRAILLNNGAIVADGRCHDVLNSPELDKAFGIAFQRLSIPLDRLIVLPI